MPENHQSGKLLKLHKITTRQLGKSNQTTTKLPPPKPHYEIPPDPSENDHQTHQNDPRKIIETTTKLLQISNTKTSSRTHKKHNKAASVNINQ